MKNSRQVIGKWGENVASEYLSNRGWTMIARNLRTPYGELDLIARKGDVLVFFEVKTRTNQAYGLPEQAVTRAKAVHLLESSQFFLQQHPEMEGDWRVDVIAIQGKPDAPGTRIVWFENVLS
jgi:putative endonuclease